MKRTTFLSTGTIAWGVIIFVLCAMPSSDLPNPGLNIPHLDKAVHFGMHFIMALFIITLLHKQNRLSWSAILGIAISFTMLYGGLIEILQASYFNRGGDWWDEIANITGAVTACILYRPLQKEKDKWISRFKNGK